MRQRTDDLQPALRQLLDDVDEYGVHIVHITADDKGPAYSFTVGMFENFAQPELIVFGLEEEVAHELLNAAADEADAGHQYLDGSKLDGLLVDYPVRFVTVPKTCYAEHLGLAVWAYEGDSFPCVQMVWPDKQGRWPWDAGVREGFAASQPVLGRKAP